MDIEKVEQYLKKIESVISCKIILDEKDDIDEIHIVANTARSVKQILRDIQSVLTATFDIHIDYKKISIAQIDEEVVPKKEPRLQLKGIEYANQGTKAKVKIVLSNETESFETSLLGINTHRNMERMLVNATLKAVENACGIEDTFIMDDIQTVSMATERVTLVIITCMSNGTEYKFSGSGLVKSDHKEAVVKATLDALNRYIAKLH